MKFEDLIFSMKLEEVLKMFPLDNVCLDLSGISLQNFKQQRDLPHRPGRAKQEETGIIALIESEGALSVNSGLLGKGVLFCSYFSAY